MTVRAEAIRIATRRVFARSEDAPESECIFWTGSLNADGYGQINYVGIGGPRLAHRVVAEWALGPLPADKVTDHVCHTESSCAGGPTCTHRRCVNPDHLELVTRPENTARSWPARKPTCSRGHEFDEKNTRLSRGVRECRKCAVRRVDERRKRKRQQRAAAEMPVAS